MGARCRGAPLVPRRILRRRYATRAYFYSRGWDPTPGIDELHRAVMRVGPLAIVDNLDGDDVSAMSDDHYTSDPEFWGRNGFELEEIETSVRVRDARGGRPAPRLLLRRSRS